MTECVWKCGAVHDRPTQSRRQILKAGLTGAAAVASMINVGRYAVFAASDATYTAKAIALVNQNLVIDMLSVLGDFSKMFGAGGAKAKDALVITDEHLEKIRSSGINVYHPAMGLGGRDDALAFIARLNGYAAERPDVFRRVDDVADLDLIKARDKIGYIVGVQNAQHFEQPDDVNEFYNLGQRISQLTYNAQNLIGAGSTERVDGGVSDFGVSIIERMNDVGMAIDVSHCGDRTTLDAFEISKKPVLITHSNARSLVQGHARCKSDEAIKKMAKTGGVMGITGVRNFVRNKEPTTIEHMLDHFDYVARLVGVDHVGIGSDMDPDGYDNLPEDIHDQLKRSYTGAYKFRGKIDTDGFDHPRKIFDLTDGLIRRGYSDADIALILGGNFKRVLGDIWKS